MHRKLRGRTLGMGRPLHSPQLASHFTTPVIPGANNEVHLNVPSTPTRPNKLDFTGRRKGARVSGLRAPAKTPTQLQSSISKNLPTVSRTKRTDLDDMNTMNCSEDETANPLQPITSVPANEIEGDWTDPTPNLDLDMIMADITRLKNQKLESINSLRRGPAQFNYRHESDETNKDNKSESHDSTYALPSKEVSATLCDEHDTSNVTSKEVGNDPPQISNTTAGKEEFDSVVPFPIITQNRDDNDDFDLSKSNIFYKIASEGEQQETFTIGQSLVNRVIVQNIPNDQTCQAFSKLGTSLQKEIKHIYVGQYFEYFEDYKTLNNTLAKLYKMDHKVWACSLCAHLGFPINKFKTDPFHSFASSAKFEQHYERQHVSTVQCKICFEQYGNLTNLKGHLDHMKFKPNRMHAVHMELNK